MPDRRSTRILTLKKGLTLHRYRAFKMQRLRSEVVVRTEHGAGGRGEYETIFEEMQGRLNNAPDTTRVREHMVEHPFGTLK